MENDEINLLEGVFNTTTQKKEAKDEFKDIRDAINTHRSQKRSDSGRQETEANTSTQNDDIENKPESLNSLVPTKTLLIKYSRLTLQGRKRKHVHLHLPQTLHSPD